jgi:sugar lactone lactonase YvrE
VVEYDRDGSFVRDWGTGAGLKGPAAVAAGGDVLAILDSATRRLILLGRDDRPIASGDYASLGLSLPKALAFAADGRLLVADEQAGLVMVFDRELRPGAHIGPAGPGSGSSTVRMAPTDVRVDRAGTIYVYEGNNAGRIRRFAADGTPMPVWDTGLQGGGRIAPVGDGSVWVSGRQEDGLRRIDASGARTGEIRPPAMVGGTGEGGVFGLAIDERGVFNVLWHYGGVISYRVPASG